MKTIPLILITVLISACERKNNCEKLSSQINMIYGQELLVDLKQNRAGFFNELVQLENTFKVSDPTDVYKILTNENMSPSKRAEYLELFGGLLLHTAVIYNEPKIVQYYLESGVSALKHYQFIGVPIITIVEKQDIELFKILKKYYANDSRTEKIYLDVENYFNSCF